MTTHILDQFEAAWAKEDEEWDRRWKSWEAAQKRLAAAIAATPPPGQELDPVVEQRRLDWEREQAEEEHIRQTRLAMAAQSRAQIPEDEWILPVPPPKAKDTKPLAVTEDEPEAPLLVPVRFAIAGPPIRIKPRFWIDDICAARKRGSDWSPPDRAYIIGNDFCAAFPDLMIACAEATEAAYNHVYDRWGPAFVKRIRWHKDDNWCGVERRKTGPARRAVKHATGQHQLAVDRYIARRSYMWGTLEDEAREHEV